MSFPGRRYDISDHSLGVFVANADGSLVIASSQKIASDFNALNSASWLVTSYVLAQCASQPLVGTNVFF